MAKLMYRFFKQHEFDCTHIGTGGDKMDPAFVHKLDELRERCGFSFRITSGWRDLTHPVESKKEKGGTHTQGIACDIAVIEWRRANEDRKGSSCNGLWWNRCSTHVRSRRYARNHTRDVDLRIK